MAILAMQVGGFAAALALLIAATRTHGWFVAAFGVHVVGDVLFVVNEGGF